LHKNEADEHRRHVVMIFNNLLIISHKVIFSIVVRNSQQQI